MRAASDVQVLHILQGHAKPLSFVAWSPDDSLILTCGNDNKIKLWDTLSGKLRRTYDKHADPVTACAWFPDGRRFVSGGVDKCTFMWDIDGNELEQWAGARINDLAISSDGAQMVRRRFTVRFSLQQLWLELRPCFGGALTLAGSSWSHPVWASVRGNSIPFGMPPKT